MILKSETHCQAIAKRRGKKSEVISIESIEYCVVEDVCARGVGNSDGRVFSLRGIKEYIASRVMQNA